jgi:hypothetical protein
MGIRAAIPGRRLAWIKRPKHLSAFPFLEISIDRYQRASPSKAFAAMQRPLPKKHLANRVSAPAKTVDTADIEFCS